MNKIIRFIVLVSMIWMSVSCAKENLFSNDDGSHTGRVCKGDVLISLSESEDLINKFYIEIFNSSNTRVYRDKYLSGENKKGSNLNANSNHNYSSGSNEKMDAVRLNVGKYTLLAMCGDSLSYGFDRPYYEAKQKFEVHSLKDNGGHPDRVKIVAKLANVGFNVVYGDNLKQYYEDYYVILHRKDAPATNKSIANKSIANKSIANKSTTKKECKIKFSKSEERTAYTPAGEVYLEIFAKRKGETKYGYYKTEPKIHTSNDFVNYNVDTNPINGDISLNIKIDNSVQLVEEDFTIPESALPGKGLTYYKDGVKFETLQENLMMGSYFKPAEEHISINSTDGLKSLSLILQPADLLEDKSLIKNTALLPVLDVLRNAKFTSEGVDLMTCSEEVKQALQSVGIDWKLYTNHGYLDLANLFAEFSLLKSSSSDGSLKVASLIMKGVDNSGNKTEAKIDFQGNPMPIKLNVDENNMWTDAARGISISADTFNETSTEFSLNEKSIVGLQFSEDGSTWKDVKKVDFVDGKQSFDDIENLTMGNDYYFRAIINEDENLLSDVVKIGTEKPEYLLNSDFKQSREHIFITIGSYWFSTEEYEITWWQFDEGGSHWAVNSPVTMMSNCRKGTPDFHSFPTVSITNEGNIMIASASIGHYASSTNFGYAYTGELFLGKSNAPADGDIDSPEDWNESYWKKTIDSVEFNARPKALKFTYKLDNFNNDPIYAEIKLYDDEGTIIGEGHNDTINQTVTEWTEAYIPVNYTIMNKKATHLGISIRSSATNNSESREVVVHTKSGEHTIHAGNLLYLSSVNLDY